MPSTTAISRRTLSTRAMAIFAFITAVSFSAASSAPTPLYHLYQTSMGLSPLLITIVFAAYAFGLLGALLTVGSLSDYIGRRPMIFAALLINAGALAIFAFADSATLLIAARAIQGFATGIALTTLGATIVDTDKARGPMLNSITAFIGLTTGSLFAGFLVSFAPAPLHLVYEILLTITLAELVLLAVLPETTTGKPGALAAMVPHVSVPKQAIGTMLKITPLNVAGWALGGFYLSLMPSLVALATGVSSPFLGGSVVASLMLTATLSVLLLRHWSPERLLRMANVSVMLGVAVTLGGVYLHSAIGLFLGTIIAGTGFGAAYSGNLRSLLPLAKEHERAGLLAAYFVESYLAFSLLAIVAGLLAPVLGLVETAYWYGGAVIVLAAISYGISQRKVIEPRLG